MIILVTGGSASGKSEIAERIAVSLSESRVYIATMQPFGDEAAARIRRHQEQRSGRGFETIERYHSIENLMLPRGTGCALLECLSNLVANEMFSRNVPEAEIVAKIYDGFLALRQKALHLVVVTNEIFSDEKRYDEHMRRYLRALGECNVLLAKLADTVVESVVGIPVVLKGEFCVENPR